MRWVLILALPVVACASAPDPTDDDVSFRDGDSGDDDSGDDGSCDGDSGDDDATPDRLDIRFLGVGGVAMRHGDDLILTAPLFTNPDLLTVTTGSTVSDAALADQGAWLDQDFCGGRGRTGPCAPPLRGKLLDDPF
jgi:hypothetical protein